MIAFYGRPDDAPLTLAIQHATAHEIPHVVLDQARLDRGSDLPLETITAVYARPLALPPCRDPQAGARAAQLHATFMEWLDEAAVLVANRPRAMYSNGSKPYQLQLIAAAGFAVPETLVTNRPEDVLTFRARHGRIIYKSISGIRSIVRELDAHALARLDRVRALPTQFQAHVEGVDVRVHVVGDRTLAAEIRSTATDYRYAHRDDAEVDLRAAVLPPAIHDRCVALARALDLPFCGIDLRRRPDGEHVCFEVNPMPGYSYFERETGLPIAAELVDLLARAAPAVP